MTNKLNTEEIKDLIIKDAEDIFKAGIEKIPPEQLNKLYKEFCRLSGYSAPKSPIDSMIDKATGFEEERMTEFASFLMQYVFMPVINQIDTD